MLKCEKLSHHNGIKLLAIISAILITLSTMFIKQHSIIDAVMAGILSIILYVLVYKVDYTKKFIKKMKEG